MTGLSVAETNYKPFKTTIMKLQELSINYQIHEEHHTVVAKLESRVLDNSGFSLHFFKVTGVARAENEPFNEAKSKKLARARAEKEVYIQYRNFLKQEIRDLDNRLNELSSALNKVNTHIENQKEYIKTF